MTPVMNDSDPEAVENKQVNCYRAETEEEEEEEEQEEEEETGERRKRDEVQDFGASSYSESEQEGKWGGDRQRETGGGKEGTERRSE